MGDSWGWRRRRARLCHRQELGPVRGVAYADVKSNIVATGATVLTATADFKPFGLLAGHFLRLLNAGPGSGAWREDRVAAGGGGDDWSPTARRDSRWATRRPRLTSWVRQTTSLPDATGLK